MSEQVITETGTTLTPVQKMPTISAIIWEEEASLQSGLLSEPIKSERLLFHVESASQVPTKN
jgi:hypothetical protein